MTEMDAYDFELPRELIAQQPAATRSDARLMLIDRRSGTIDHAHVRDLGDYLDVGDALVLNNSRVVPARLAGYRIQTRGRWQGLFLAADEQTGVWEVLTKMRGKLIDGEAIMIQDRHGRDSITLRCIARTETGTLLVKPEEAGPAIELLQRYGRVPLPPYIRDGQMVDADLSDYQTVYAKEPGSVAAPTAGLHFTDTLLQSITAAGVQLATVTLHVGIGTFRPIAVQSLDEHQMHREWGEIDAANCEKLSAAWRRWQTHRRRRHDLGAGARKRRTGQCRTSGSLAWRHRSVHSPRAPFRRRRRADDQLPFATQLAAGARDAPLPGPS